MSLQPFAAPAATRGAGILSAGAATVAATAVRAGSVIVLTAVAPLSAPGALAVASLTPGTGFTVSSSSGTDASAFTWVIL
jgi:hypothetical protein